MPFNCCAVSSDGRLAQLIFIAEPNWRRNSRRDRRAIYFACAPGSFGEPCVAAARGGLLPSRGSCSKRENSAFFFCAGQFIRSSALWSDVSARRRAANPRFEREARPQAEEGKLPRNARRFIHVSLLHRPTRLIHTTPPHWERSDRARLSLLFLLLSSPLVEARLWARLLAASCVK